MNMRHIIPASIFASLLLTGVASAQTTTNAMVNGVQVSSTPVTSTITPGATGATFGTFTLVGDQNGATVLSLPLTVTPGGGATVSNLSNCQVFNANGTALTTGGNIVNSVSAGSAVFTFDQPLTVSQAAGTTTLSVRCNVASNAPSTGTFQFMAGTPMFGSMLGVNLDVAPSVPAGSTDVALANISLDATHSGSPIRITSIPVTISAAGGGSTANLTDCRVRNSANVDGWLTANAPAIQNGTATSFTLDVPLTVMGGFAQMLSVTCDVAPAAPVGSTFTVSIAPNTVAASNASTGASVTPVATVGTGANGLPAATSGTIIVSAATGDVPPVDNGTPGVPNTGAGGLALQLLAVLMLSGVVATGGAMYLKSQV